MPKVSCLIVEDDELVAADLKTDLLALDYEVHWAKDIKEGYGLYFSIQPDILILDIYFDGHNDGIEFARTIQERTVAKTPVVFLTNSTDSHTFAEAKSLLPFSYLLKPFNPLELQYAIELALQHQDNDPFMKGATHVPRFFFVKSRDRMMKIAPAELDYVEVSSRYCDLWRDQEKFVVQYSLLEIRKMLPAELFIRIHRNFLINLSKLESIHLAEYSVKLKNGKELSISRRYLEDLRKRFEVLS